MALLALVGVSLIGAAFASTRGASARSSGTLAALAAESGMDYAAARLRGESAYPRCSATPADRGDDWTGRRRSGGGGQGSDNPSYSHGEPWLDDGDGAWETGEPFLDRDGDGRPSAWTGRLRGARGGLGAIFSLRIESEDGKVPLNTASTRYLDKPTDPQQQSLCRVLNNLGAVLQDPFSGLPRIPTRRWAVPAAGEPLRASWLGFDLLASRPVDEVGIDGIPVRRYLTDWDEVRTLLPAYASPEIEALRPFVSLGPYACLNRGRVPDSAIIRTTLRYAPVNLWTAPREVLVALWMYVAAPNPFAAPSPVCYGEPEGVAKSCPHSGLLFSQVQLILWPREAEALADLVLLHRRRGDRSWEGLRRAFSENAATLFQEDHDALADAVLPGPSPFFRRSWVQAKANLAYQAVAMDPYPFRGSGNGLEAWATGGIDADPVAGGFQPQPAIGLAGLSHVPYPAAFDPSTPPEWSGTLPYGAPGPEAFPLGLTTAPPIVYSALSLGTDGGGGAAEREGICTTAVRLDFVSQEDFEAWNDPSPWWGAALGVEVVQDPLPWRRRDADDPSKPGACLSLPASSAWSSYDRSNAAARSGHYFSRACGVLIPADQERRGGDLCWTFSEDFNGRADMSGPPGPGLELWSAYSGYTATRNGYLPTRPPTIGWPPPYRFGSSLPLAKSEDPCRFRHRNAAGTFVEEERFQCPGFDPPFVPGSFNSKPGFVREFTMEGWLGPGGAIVLKDDGTGEIKVSTRRGWKDSPDHLGTYVSLFVLWGVGGYYGSSEQTASIGKQTFSPDEVFIPDDPARPGRSHHVALTGQRFGDGMTLETAMGTRFRLHVDGACVLDAPWIGSPPSGAYGHSRALLVPTYEKLQLAGVDDLRFSKGVQSPAYGDRFRASATYTSPLYRFDAPARAGLAQWSGIVPEGYGSIAVEAVPCDASGTELGAFPLAGSGKVSDLAALGMPACRAFRYKVRFTGTQERDAPVFESLWLTFRRQGAANAWSAWESR